jgi:predicted nucleic acid-binding protein
VIVLSDTSPLNYLLLIGHVEILPAIFGQLVIPAAVAAELAHPRAPDVVRQWIVAPPPWCQVRQVAQMDPTIQLGKGESEAISLAIEIKADLLLEDDRLARAHAEQRGIKVAGTLNVLELAAQRQLLVLADAVRRLKSTNFHIADEVIARLLSSNTA